MRFPSPHVFPSSSKTTELTQLWPTSFQLPSLFPALSCSLNANLLDTTNVFQIWLWRVSRWQEPMNSSLYLHFLDPSWVNPFPKIINDDFIMWWPMGGQITLVTLKGAWNLDWHFLYEPWRETRKIARVGFWLVKFDNSQARVRSRGAVGWQPRPQGLLVSQLICYSMERFCPGFNVQYIFIRMTWSYHPFIISFDNLFLKKRELYYLEDWKENKSSEILTVMRK